MGQQARATSGKILVRISKSDIPTKISDLENDVEYVTIGDLSDFALLSDITFETLFLNNDIGSGADQLAPGDHDHDVGDLQVLFENRIT